MCWIEGVSSTFKKRAVEQRISRAWAFLEYTHKYPAHMRARERLPGQLTATCFHIAILPLPPPFPFFLPLSRPLLSSSRFNPPTRMNPLARMQVAKRQLSSRERKRERESYGPLVSTTLRLPSTPFSRSSSKETKLPETRPLHPRTVSSFQPRKVSARSDLRCTRARWLASAPVSEDGAFLIFFLARIEVQTRHYCRQV